MTVTKLVARAFPDTPAEWQRQFCADLRSEPIDVRGQAVEMLKRLLRDGVVGPAPGQFVKLQP